MIVSSIIGSVSIDDDISEHNQHVTQSYSRKFLIPYEQFCAQKSSSLNNTRSVWYQGLAKH